jgi:hypothetical protein
MLSALSSSIVLLATNVILVSVCISPGDVVTYSGRVSVSCGVAGLCGGQRGVYILGHGGAHVSHRVGAQER